MDRDTPRSTPPTPPTHTTHTTPTCVSCGYELTGLQVEGTCPECGSPVWQPPVLHDPYMGLSITSFVCGILSLIGCFAVGPFAFLPALVGVVTGEIAAAKYKRSTIRSSGRGLAIAGRIMSWIGVAIGLAFIGLILFALASP